MSDTAPELDLQKSRFAVTMESGDTYPDLRIMPGDIVKTERRYDIGGTEMQSNPRFEWVLYMLWMSAKRRGYTADFETFVDSVTGLDITSDTQPLPTAPVP
jgi:hypothetical protein